MTFPKTQNPFDWITQSWNILLGRITDVATDAWLLGPIGCVKEHSDDFIMRLASDKQLSIAVNAPGAGLMENMDEWPVAVGEKIEDFYLRTSVYHFEVRTAWKPVFGSLGYLIARMFSRRIQQLNLPGNTTNEPMEISSDIIQLLDDGGKVHYTIWRRSVRDTGEVVYFGIYTTCQIPSGEICVKVIFPLPCGNATVIFRAESYGNHKLLLDSSGKTYGDPGFYFLVEDCKGVLWKHFLPSFRERILVSENDQGELTAEHTLKLWSFHVYRMVYSMTEGSQSTSA